MTNHNDKAVEESIIFNRTDESQPDTLFDKIDAISNKNTFIELDRETENRRSAEISEKLAEIFDSPEAIEEQEKAHSLSSAISGAREKVAPAASKAKVKIVPAISKAVVGVKAALSGLHVPAGAKSFASAITTIRARARVQLAKVATSERREKAGELLYIVVYAFKLAGRSAKSYAVKAAVAVKPGFRKIINALAAGFSRMKLVKRTTWIAVSGGGAGVVAVAMAGFLLVGSPMVSVAIGGQSVGYVTDEAELGVIVESVKEEISEENSDAVIIIDDQKIALASSPTTSKAAADTPVDKEQLKEQLIALDAVVASAYAITIDDKLIANVATEEEAQSVLDTVVANYTGDATVPHEWEENVKIENVAADLGSLQATEAAIEYMLRTNQAEEIYTVKDGDTLWQISIDTGKSLDEIAAINPKLDVEDIHTGDEIKLTKVEYNVHVKTFEQVSETEAVEFKTKKVKTSDLYKGQTKVKKEGVLGEREVTYEITKVNGEETERKELTSVTTKKPKTQTVLVGTKAKPEGDFYDDGSGGLSNPMRNMQISSGYMGNRNHTGVDFRNPNGTPIYASASGTVTYAGYDGAYGNIIRISHGGGLSTWYAHCSSMLVHAGQSVSRGQQIGKVGATGRATGYHLHFEVRVNGSPRNPLGYL
jgi:murein DD-endopeptidase MepM/ murein hydrolase activator NlpD